MPRKPKAPDPLPVQRRAPGTGSVGVRADGRIFVTLPPDLDKKRRPIYGPGQRRRFLSRDAAELWLVAEISRRRNPAPRAASLDEAVGSYLTRWHKIHAPSMPPRTARAYWISLRHFLPLIGKVRLGDLTHEEIQGALADLQRMTWRRRRKDGTPTSGPKRYSARTIAQARMVLHMALNQIVPHILPFNPVTRSKLGKTQAPEQPVWDGEQADRFLDVADADASDIALAYRLILRRALRRGEVLSLQWPDIDERRSLIIVDETAGDRVGETGETKGRKRREVPISASLLTALRRRRAAQPRPSPWVFAHEDKPWHAQILNRRAAALCKKAGVPYITPKDMRATCATLLLDEGVSLAKVSRLLGHANTKITAQFYDRVLRRRDEHLARVSDELDAALDRAIDAAKDAAPFPLHQAAD